MSSDPFNNDRINGPEATPPSVSQRSNSGNPSSSGLRLKIRVPKAAIMNTRTRSSRIVLRSGTRVLPSPGPTQESKPVSKKKNPPSTSGTNTAYASANPLQSTVVDETVNYERFLSLPLFPTFPDADGKMPGIEEAERDDSSTVSEENVIVEVEEEVRNEKKQPNDHVLHTRKEVVRRDRNIYDYAKPWQNSTGKSHFTEKEIQEELKTLAATEFHGTAANRFWWKKEGVTMRTAEKQTRQVHKCHFKNESNCKFQLCVVRDIESQLSTIFIGNRPHSDHTINYKKRGISSQVLAELVTSPATLRRKGVKTMVNAAMHQKKIRLDKTQQRKASRAIYRLKSALENEILGGLDGKTFEGLDRKLDSFKKINILLDEAYDEDTFFLCGDYKCDGTEGKERIAAMFSTDNLLLNMYRWWCTGYDLTFSVDTSYRYMVQGFGLLPIRVLDFSQTSHVVGYGLLNKEDIRAHAFLFYQLKVECERVVEYYRDIGYFDEK